MMCLTNKKRVTMKATPKTDEVIDVLKQAVTVINLIISVH